MVVSPRNTANLLPTRSRMGLHPPAGDADQRLHRDYLSPRPHRPVLTGSLETEPYQPGYLASSASGSSCPTPHVFPRLFKV
tara:strand:+ start:5959 stop:6201 length:243 start_codon:yes stop_codon:yes gene_type:complete